MLKPFPPDPHSLVPEPWYLDLPPAEITVCHLKTERQVQDLTLLAAGVSPPHPLLAVGRQALSYQNDPGAVVFSPFRRGQIAHYEAARQLIKALLKQTGCGAVLLPKPVMCLHVQEDTSQVEEVALAEAAIQCGARKV